MASRLVEQRKSIRGFVATVAVFGYLLLAGPLPGPMGEQYGNYLGALFGGFPSVDHAVTLLVRSSLIFLLGFYGSWAVLAWFED